MTVKALWEINQYTITFNTNGGSEISSMTQDYATAVEAPADPTRDGYTFIGWDTEIPETMPAEDVTITASWEANENTISIYLEKGDKEPYCTITAKTDEDILEQHPEDPAKTGHTFGGWVDKDGKAVVLPGTMPTADMELYAKWNISEYTITFDLSGGMIGEETVYTIVQDFDTAVTVPENPTREGYTFLGWDKDIPVTMPGENVTITAQWKVNRYTIVYRDDSGKVLSSATLNYGTLINVPNGKNFEAQKPGYTFVKWNEEIPVTMPARNVIITSTWQAKSYTITFNTDGGTEMEPITAEYGTALTRPADPTKEAYTFTGWDQEFPETMPARNLTLTAQWAQAEYAVNWVNHDGTILFVGTVKHGELAQYGGETPVKAETAEFAYTFTGWDPAIEAATGSMTYTAQFAESRKSYTITYVYGNGEENGSQTVENGAVITAPETPVREGYVFQGWNPELPDTMPAQNISVTAQWKKVEYAITFDTDGGSIVAAITTGWGEAVAKPADPTREGYTFGGWIDAAGETVALPETMPVGGLELKAVWNVNQYTITFDTDGGSAVAPITLDYGTVITDPAAPEKESYIFRGWTPELPKTMPAADLTVKAQWEYVHTGWLTEEMGTTYLIKGQKTYYAQWAKIDGSYYFFDDQSYIVTGMFSTTAADGSHEGTFIFGEDGKFLSDLTDVYVSDAGDTWWIENGEVTLDKGLTRVVLEDGEVNYYYFAADGKAVKNKLQWVYKHNDLLIEWHYNFDENGIIPHNEDTTLQGVHPDENGVDCYYMDGVKVPRGIFIMDGYYYYASQYGDLVKGRQYWISITNGILPEGSYLFDEEGRIVFEEKKNGIYEEDDSLYLYKDGARYYAGLFLGDGTVGDEGRYYYANTYGELIHGRSYWITKTNDLLPEKRYTFDEEGRIVFEEEEVKKNGFVQENGGIYYYVDGALTYAGLIEVDGYYYYVNSSCKVITGCKYWITKTNGLMAEKAYTFDDQGRMVMASSGSTGFVEENGGIYYYVNGELTYAGLIEVDGNYYYVNSTGKVITGRKYWIAKTNGLMSEGSYVFDVTGKMIVG